MPFRAERYVVPPLPPLETGCCVLFCDALRMDLGRQLAADLAGRGLAADLACRLAALPPVTPTAKPAVSPVAGQIAGLNRHDLVPGSAAGGAAVTVAVLRSLLHAAGYQVLGAAFVVDAVTANAGWIVTGCGIIPS
jgi:hypothetical protein